MSDATTTRFPLRIVAGVDDDERSDAAVDAALALARRFRARLELVHAFPEAALEVLARGRGLPAGTLDAEAEVALRRRLSTHVRALLARLEEDPDPPRLQLVAGPPAVVLLDRARHLDADLVVIGPHRRGGKLEFGSTTRALLAEGPGAIWSQIGTWRPIERVLVPIDLTPDSLHALARARDLASGTGASVLALHCFLVPELGDETVAGAPPPAPRYSLDHLRRQAREDFERTLAAFPWHGVGHQALFEDGDPVDAILAHQERADLTVLATHGRTGLAAALLGNAADAVIRGGRRPVLAVRRTLDEV